MSVAAALKILNEDPSPRNEYCGWQARGYK
jgi:hypothetical protein